MARSGYAQLTERLGRRLVEQIERAERVQLRTIRRVRALLDRLPTLPSLPLVDRLPAPATIAEANFALAERVLEAQKTLTLSLLDALFPGERPRKKPRPV
jgi:hypothetical protein